MSSRTAAAIAEFRALRLRDGVLPLAADRMPFQQLGDSTIGSVVAAAERDPTRAGRLTRLVRQSLGLVEERPRRHARCVLEAHIDLTSAPAALANGLVRLGFEPDNFAECQPAQYVRHFTREHRCMPSDDVRAIYADLWDSAEKAFLLIDAETSVEGYVEVEHYKQANAWSDGDPLPAGNCELPCLVPRIDAQKRGADVHLKVAGLTPGDTRSSVAFECLRDRLCDMGFYSIVSEAGNRIFTAHFVGFDQASRILPALVSVVAATPLRASVVAEVCTSLRRTVRVVSGKVRHAEVPPVFEIA